MSQQGSDLFQSHTTLHQVLGKGMPTDMWGQGIDLRFPTITMQDALHAPAIESLGLRSFHHRPQKLAWRAHADPFLQSLARFRVQRHVALFATFALPDQYTPLAFRDLEVCQVQLHGLAQAQASMQQEQYQRGVPPACHPTLGVTQFGKLQIIFDGARQGILFVLVQPLGTARHIWDALDILGGIALDLAGPARPFGQGSQGSQPAIDRAGFALLHTNQKMLVFFDIRGCDALDGERFTVGLFKPAGEVT